MFASSCEWEREKERRWGRRERGKPSTQCMGVPIPTLPCASLTVERKHSRLCFEIPSQMQPTASSFALIKPVSICTSRQFSSSFSSEPRVFKGKFTAEKIVALWRHNLILRAPNFSPSENRFTSFIYSFSYRFHTKLSCISQSNWVDGRFTGAVRTV